MKSNKTLILIIGLVLLVSLLLFSVTYSVRFNEVVIVTTFGEASGESSVRLEPGLHFKLPAPIQAAKKLDRRLQLVDTRLETQATKDGLQVIVQAFVLWRIDDSTAASILKFNQSYGSVDSARNDLEARMRSAISALSAYEFSQLIGESSRLAEAEDAIQARLAAGGSNTASLTSLGVRIEKVGLSQVLLPVETTTNVIQRMESERKLRAETVRDRGAAEAQSIMSEGSLQTTTILSHASLLAQQIRAQGDELASGAVTGMSVDPEFATFLIWLDALEKTSQRYSTYFIPLNFAPFHLLNFNDPNMQGHIPMPRSRFPSSPVGEAAETEEQADASAGVQSNG